MMMQVAALESLHSEELELYRSKYQEVSEAHSKLR